jgi:hypothetical protein
MRVTPDSLRDLVGLLSSASYHYADNSAGEWGSARDCLRRFAATVNAARLPYDAIVALHRDKPQLVTLDQVMDAVLKAARG